ncbi:hypothetical protein AQ802_23220 [Burkholderia pseudomallei]|nr:hypothetical protein AQ744_10295 [Burkholderia pseudomallei]OMS75042.1 hypothetical protein AQ747_17600 [Burkholderia pseudomallei]OMW11659.1 hypothetical protein AQ802_23220 [Burkholderia pseudomallei]OND73915.1 hypothetical protein AQ938_18700 [Burkholderia pseudomallei]
MRLWRSSSSCDCITQIDETSDIALRLCRRQLDQVVDGHGKCAGDLRQHVGSTDALPGFDLAEIRFADAGCCGERILRHAQMIAPSSNRVIARQFSIEHSGRDAAAVVACLGLRVERFIFEVFDQVLHAVPQFDGDHGKGPVAVLLDKLNFGHL